MVMAERRKNKKRKEGDAKDWEQKPTKEEYAIAKYLKQKLPEKKTTLLGHKVEYFIGSKAVDCLMDSQWAKGDKKAEISLTTRESIVDFMAKLLFHKFFHRAKKIVVQKDPKKKKKDVEETAIESSKEKEPKKVKGKSETVESKDEKPEDKKEICEVTEKKKEKKKIKLDMHLQQTFVDSNEPYVWLYDPIPVKTWIVGTLMVIGAVLVCLFPLWPLIIRHYIYYLSVAAAFFLAFIIGLAVLRLVVFILIWLVTFGKHHLWLLPNLTEDVGFLESFWPLYKYEYKGSAIAPDKKDKDSDCSEKKEVAEIEEKVEEKDLEKSEGSSTDQEGKGETQNNSESEESEAEKPKAENGFEFVEVEEADEDSEEVEESVAENAEEEAQNVSRNIPQNEDPKSK